MSGDYSVTFERIGLDAGRFFVDNLTVWAAVPQRKESIMGKIPQDYIERVYAGWIGKVIGVRFGAPIEGWSSEDIRKKYGVLETYIDDGAKLFAADDDTNGPLAMLMALRDFTHTQEITAREMGETLLNYAPYEHGFFWWGGYGMSTEHTAFINLWDGIEAPYSGSIAHNGAAVAEQIGGQIFIDTWGLIAPGDPELAADYARKAACVTHDGNGIYGGVFVAAAIALAFAETDIRRVIEKALEQIPVDCEYRRMSDAVIKFFDEDEAKDWESALRYIQANWGYDRYPGACHIIPNAAVMVMSMLYGGGDYSRTICICNMSGWDTDCNVGNVGTILGVLVGLDGIAWHWRTKTGDAFALSTVLGSRNYLDAAWCAEFIALLGYKIAGEEIPEQWQPFLKAAGFHLHFEFPGSVQGMTVYREEEEEDEEVETAESSADSSTAPKATATTPSADLAKPVKTTVGFTLMQTDSDAATGTGSLLITTPEMGAGEQFFIAKKTHFRPEDFNDSRYDPSFSPLIYPGQTIRVRVKNLSCAPCIARLYVCDANHALTGDDSATDIATDTRDANGATRHFGAPARIENTWQELTFTIPGDTPACIDELGIAVEICDPDTYRLLIDDLVVDGTARYKINFTREKNEKWTFFHTEVSQFSYLRGLWRVEADTLTGTGPAFAEAYTGNAEWSAIDFAATVTPLFLGAPDQPERGHVGIGFRIQGARRSYAATLGDGKISLLKKVNGVFETLTAAPYNYILNEPVRLHVHAEGAAITLSVDGQETLTFTDANNPYLQGCIGAILRDGARASFKDWVICATA